MARKYIKRSDYWKKFDPNKKDLSELLTPEGHKLHEVVASAGEAYYERISKAYSRHEVKGNTGPNTESRYNRASDSTRQNRFANISEGILPWANTGSYINVQDTIVLCQKAYANIAIFRNAIDIMAEFANSDVYLEGGTAKSREFVYKWFEKFKLWELKDQYFREYYRSGNIFLYRLDGKFTAEDFSKMSTVYGGAEELVYPRRKATFGLKPGTIPIKYVMLNPYDILATRALTFSFGKYEKILSEYEIEALKNPQTEHDKEIYEGLPQDVKDKIKNNEWNQNGIYMELDPGKLIFSFYKKQDYEPFAVPFGYPVLDDINWKIELKKMDQAITRTVENVVLLITMGNEPDKGGINPVNFQAMQSLFQNESVGRVLISDYTTKADFIIPDLGKVLGPEKYEIVNNDIREGLQNIIVGEEKFSNKQIKAEIFFERLREAREAFISDFLQPQIKMVCKQMGFRKFPIARFTDKDIKDEVQFHRVTTRLMELGILTPTQGIEAMETGLLPRVSDMHKAQEEFAEDRSKGLYNPLVGGVPPLVEMEDEQSESLKRDEKGGRLHPQTVTDVSDSPGRPLGATGDDLYSRKGIQKTIYEAETLRSSIVEKVKSHFKIKRMSKQKNQFVDALLENVIISTEKGEWEAKAHTCIEDLEQLDNLPILPGVSEMSVTHNLTTYPSALLYHSKNIP